MKTNIMLLNIFLLLFILNSCDTQEIKIAEDALSKEEEDESTNPNLPEGYFEVRFATSVNNTQTKAPVSGVDSRVQHIQYIIYKSTGEYVKEKTILVPSQGAPSWPLAAIKDTLPNGEYRVVFLCNVEKTLFPYASESSPENYADILTDYQTVYSNGRIHLPPAEFANNTEYYWDNVEFSNTSPNPAILLQRIIGSAKLERVFVDGQSALDSLVYNIVTQIGYKNIIRNTVDNILPGQLRNVISPILGTFNITGLVGRVDSLVNPLVDVLVEPLTDTLYNLLLEELVAQIGNTLVGNSDKQALIDYLGDILNPWNNSTASNTVVSIRDYPKSIDFDLNVTDIYPGINQFMYGFNTDSIHRDRHILLKNFNSIYDVRKIDVVGAGLVGGVVVDQVIDEFLLAGSFVDINDSIQVIGDKTNRRYQSKYSLAALRLKSYTLQTDGAHSLTLSVKIGDIANIDNILNTTLTGALNVVADLLGPIVGTALRLIISTIVLALNAPIKNITVSVPINLPLLGIDNLEVSGSWGPITQY